MTILNAIYLPGELCLQTTTYLDKEGVERCNYSDLTVDEYLAQPEKEGMVCIQFAAALKEIEKVENEKLVGPWQEIDEEKYMDALEVLPPQKWDRIPGVGSIFRCCEYTTGNLTAHYAAVKGRFFAATRRITVPYSEMVEQIRTQFSI